MADSALSIIDIKQITDEISIATNIPLTYLNDHVIRVSVMTEPYFWHYHPNSDETFMVLEGSVFIDLEDKTIELFPNQLFTIPKSVKHCTRPNGSRSVNLTFESADLVTTKTDAPA
jgi:mannose-6-phosphate isomerase-like protein (cupin superfamily)